MYVPSSYLLFYFITLNLFNLFLQTDFPTLCDALISKKPQDLEGFKFLLDNYLK